MAQSLADAGAISQDDVDRHPSRHVLTSALATRGAFVQVDLKRSRLEDGDQLLLCSDGLTEMVSDETIARVLAAPGPRPRPAGASSTSPSKSGGKDNVTVVLGATASLHARNLVPHAARSEGPRPPAASHRE